MSTSQPTINRGVKSSHQHRVRKFIICESPQTTEKLAWSCLAFEIVQMELFQYPEGKCSLWISKCSRKEPCHHQLHVTLRSFRATAPADPNFMDTRPINNGYKGLSPFVMTPRCAAKAKTGRCVIVITAAFLVFLFAIIVHWQLYFSEWAIKISKQTT